MHFDPILLSRVQFAWEVYVRIAIAPARRLVRSVAA